MPHVKPSVIREMTESEIQTRVAELREELFNLRFRNSMKQLDNPLKIREGRREMARLLTALRDKERAAKSPSPPGEARAKSDRRR
jgi:large subunit ribosomal protein L29